MHKRKNHVFKNKLIPINFNVVRTALLKLIWKEDVWHV